MISKSRFLVALVWICACAPTAAPSWPFSTKKVPTPAPAQDLAPLEIEEYLFQRRVLGNGLRAVAVRDEGEGVSVFMVIAAGKREETETTTGLAHLTEHAMYTGTKKTGPGEHDKRVEELGGKSNAFTREDYTFFYDHNFPTGNLAEVLGMEADRLRNLTFKKKAVLYERGRLTREEAATWQPTEVLTEALEDAVYQVHPYKVGLRSEDGHTLAPGLKIKQIKDFYNRYYQPNRVAVVVAGAVEPEEALDAIEAAFAALPRGPEVEEPPEEPEVLQPRQTTFPSEFPRDRVEWVWIVPGLEHPDRPALEVLAGVFSQRTTEQGSLLYVKLGSRVDKELFRVALIGPAAERYLTEIHGSVLSGDIDPGVVEEVKTRIADTYTDQEMRARPYFSLAGTVGVFEALGQTEQLVNYESRIQELRPADILRVARLYLDPNRKVTILFEGTGVDLPPLPEDRDELLRAAMQAMDAGELERSAKAFTALLPTASNKMTEAIYLSSRGQVRMQQRNYDLAIRDFESALELIEYPDLSDLLDEARALAAGIVPEDLDEEKEKTKEGKGDPPVHGKTKSEATSSEAASANEPNTDLSIEKDGEAELLGRVDRNKQELEQWRGLLFLEPVQPEFVEPEEVEDEKLAGWYEQEAGRLVLVKGRSAGFSRGTLLHELHHALQDQHWNLASLLGKGKTSDETRAIEGLIEGEAMLAVSEIMDYDFERHAKLPEKGAIDRAKFEKIFTYGEGLRFVKSLRAQGGWDAVDKAWAAPPTSTAELMHPERYPAGELPRLDLPLAKGEVLEEDRLGEFELSWLLAKEEATRPVSKEISAALAMDQWRLVRDSDGTLRETWDLRFTNASMAERFAMEGAAVAHAQKWEIEISGSDVRMWRPREE